MRTAVHLPMHLLRSVKGSLIQLFVSHCVGVYITVYRLTKVHAAETSCIIQLLLREFSSKATADPVIQFIYYKHSI